MSTTDAISLAKHGDQAGLQALTPWALEDALIAYCEENARAGECAGSAIGRLAREDRVAKALARAAYAAEQRLQRTLTSGQRLAAFRKHAGVKELGENAAPRKGSRAHIAGLMDTIAKRERRDGETFEDAYARLMQEDEVFRGAYAAYNEAED